MTGASAAYWLLSVLVLAQNAVAQDPTPTQNTDTAAHTPNTGYNGGDDNPMDPSDAGAAGSQTGGFSLSKGGLAAIIVVISLVVILGGKGSLLYPPKDTRTQACSFLRGSLLACKEAPMGRPSVSASRVSPFHRSLDRGSPCYETPESPDRCATRLASRGAKETAGSRERPREGALGDAEARNDNHENYEHLRYRYPYAQGSRLERHDAAREEVSEDASFTCIS